MSTADQAHDTDYESGSDDVNLYDDDDNEEYLDGETEYPESDDDSDLEGEAQEDADQEQSQADESQGQTVEVDGEQVDVAVLKESYLRRRSFEADYTRKTQYAAEVKRTAEAALQDLSGKMQALEQYASTKFRRYDPQELQRLSVENPQHYVQIQAQMQADQAEIHHLQQMSAQIEQQKAVNYQAFIHEQEALASQELQQTIVGWSDPVQFQQGIAEVGAYLATLFTQDELAPEAIVNPKNIRLAYKAMMYDKLMSAKQSHAQPPLKPRKSVRSAGQAPASGYETARKKLKKSGSLRDAAAAMARFV